MVTLKEDDSADRILRDDRSESRIRVLGEGWGGQVAASERISTRSTPEPIRTMPIAIAGVRGSPTAVAPVTAVRATPAAAHIP